MYVFTPQERANFEKLYHQIYYFMDYLPGTGGEGRLPASSPGQCQEKGFPIV